MDDDSIQPTDQGPDFQSEMERLAAEATAGNLGAPSRNGPPDELPPARSARPPVPASSQQPAQFDASQTDALLEGVQAILAELMRRVIPLQAGVDSQAPILKQLEQSVDEIRRVEGAQRKLFDAMHEELTGYKDAFLFEALQKPFVKDLLGLHDELERLTSQGLALRDSLATARKGAHPASDKAGSLADNLGNIHHLLLEILNRMDVTILDRSEGVYDAKRHRVVEVIDASHPDEHNMIAASRRAGFIWRGQSLRPEDVVVKKFRNPANTGDLPSIDDPVT